MPWTWKQIEQDWLHDGRVATEPSIVVEAFERVEAAFGRDWIEQSRILPLVVPKGVPPQSTVTGGSHPVLTVVKMGALLALAAASVGLGQRPRSSTCFDSIPPTASLSLSLRSPFPDGQTGRATFVFVGTATLGPM